MMNAKINKDFNETVIKICEECGVPYLYNDDANGFYIYEKAAYEKEQELLKLKRDPKTASEHMFAPDIFIPSIFICVDEDRDICMRKNGAIMRLDGIESVRHQISCMAA